MDMTDQAAGVGSLRANSTPLLGGASPVSTRRPSLAFNLARDVSRRGSLASPPETSLSDQLAQETSNADRVTQLQQSLDQLTSTFSNAFDFLQRRAPLVKVEASSIPVTKVNEFAENHDVFAQQSKQYAADVARIAKEVYRLINNLPGIGKTEDQQQTFIRSMDHENREAHTQLEAAVRNAEELLAMVNSILSRVVEAELRIRKGEPAGDLTLDTP